MKLNQNLINWCLQRSFQVTRRSIYQSRNLAHDRRSLFTLWRNCWSCDNLAIRMLPEISNKPHKSATRHPDWFTPVRCQHRNWEHSPPYHGQGRARSVCTELSKTTDNFVWQTVHVYGRNDKRWRRRKPMMGDRLILSVPLPSVARRNAQAVITRTEWMAIVWHFVPGRSPCLCVVMVTSLSLCILRDQREESERKVLRKFPFA